MATAKVDIIVSADALAPFTEPRTDILIETQVAPGQFVQENGPFRRYRRTVVTEIASSPGDAPDTAVRVQERTDFAMAIPVWGWGVDYFFMRRALREIDRTARHRWWWPAEVVSSTTTSLIALLSVLGMVGAYIGVNIGQTITFATAEFGSSDTAQANALAATRIGVVVSTLVIWRADVIGRKPLLIGFSAGAVLFTIVGAFSPSLLFLTATQAIARGFATGMLTLVTLAATEEIPRTMRAFILSILTMCGALGAGVVVWFLPLADLSPRGWRLVYLVPILFLPVIWWVAKVLPETRRFTAADRAHSPGLGAASRKWFLILVFIYFASNVFGAPAAQLQNEYLRDDVGFDGSDITIFRTAISTPAGLVILLAGWVADRHGRRILAAFSLTFGAVAAALFFRQTGGALWLTGGIGVWLGGAAFPVIRAYQTELFPTRARAAVGGWVDLISVAGSALGLVVCGQLIAGGRTIGEALIFLLPLPILAALSIPLLLPLTASEALEDLNPTDPRLPD